MLDEWAPQFVPKVRPSEALQAAPVVAPGVPRAVKADPPPAKVRGWRFVPERDANNLIIEIIATPIVE